MLFTKAKSLAVSALILAALPSLSSCQSAAPDEKTVMEAADAWFYTNAFGAQRLKDLSLQTLNVYLTQADPELINQNLYQSEEAKNMHKQCYDLLTYVAKQTPGAFVLAYSSSGTVNDEGLIACVSNPWTWKIEDKKSGKDAITYYLSWNISPQQSDLMPFGWSLIDFDTYFLPGSVKATQLWVSKSSVKQAQLKALSDGQLLYLTFTRDDSKKWVLSDEQGIVHNLGD